MQGVQAQAAEVHAMNRKNVVEKIMKAKMLLNGSVSASVRHADHCHLEADPDGYACSCGAEGRNNSAKAPRVSEALRELDEALDEMLR